MSLSPPFDILADFPGWTPVFEPPARQQQSRTAGGQVLVKDLGDPLWTLSATSKVLRANALDHWRAVLESLAVTQEQFLGYSLSRVYPIAYPRGSWPTGGSFSGLASLASIGGDNRSIAVSGLPAGFVLSVGDLVQLGTANLHRVREAATASGGGTTPAFTIFPNVWAGTAEGAQVSVKRPHCLMTIVPGSVSSPADPSTGSGAITFQGLEAR